MHASCRGVDACLDVSLRFARLGKYAEAEKQELCCNDAVRLLSTSFGFIQSGQYLYQDQRK